MVLAGSGRSADDPWRDLFDALHELHRAAGAPSTRQMSLGIRRSADLRDTVSHETINAMLRGKIAPKWIKLESLVLYMASNTVIPRDPERELRRFHELWLAAVDHAVPAPPSQERKLVVPSITTDAHPVRARNIPPRNPGFVGRQQLLADIGDAIADRRMSKAALPVVIHGLGGVGKTQIAIEFARTNLDRYEIVWWVRAESESLLLRSLAELGDQLGVPARQNLRLRATAVLEHLRLIEERWLLVYDNADLPKYVGPLMPVAGGQVLVTSRNSIWTAAAEIIEVDVFERRDSVALLQQQSPDMSIEDADLLAERLGDLPLALEQAASWQMATGMSVREYIHRLDERLLDTMSQGRVLGYPATLGASLGIALDRIRDQAPAADVLLGLFAFLGAQPVPVLLLADGRETVHAPEVRDLLGSAVVRDRAIRELRRFGLIRIDPKGDRIQVHRLVQQIVRNRLPADRWERSRAIVRNLLCAANPRDPRNPASWQRYAEIGPHVLPADLIHSDQLDAGHLVLDYCLYLYLVGDYDACRHLAESAHNAWSQHDENAGGEPVGNIELGLLAARRLANALRMLGEYDRARRLDEETLDRLRRYPEFGPDHEHTLLAASSVAVALRIAGQYKTASDLDKENLARHIQRFGPDDQATLRMRNNVAVNRRLLGNFAEAFVIDRDLQDHWERMFESDDPNRLLTLINLAHDLYGLGSYREALGVQREAVALFSGQVTAGHNDLLLARRVGAMALRKAGYYHEALTESEQNFHDCEGWYGPDHQHTLATAITYVNSLRVSGNVGAAYELGTNTVERYQVVFGDRHPFSLASQVNLGIVLRSVGDYRHALELDRRTESSLRTILGPQHPYTACALACLATDHALTGDLDAALSTSRRVSAVLTKIWESSHPYTLASMANAARDLIALGQVAAGDDILGATIKALTGQFTNEHPEISDLRAGVRLEFDLEPPPT